MTIEVYMGMDLLGLLPKVIQYPQCSLFSIVGYMLGTMYAQTLYTLQVYALLLHGYAT